MNIEELKMALKKEKIPKSFYNLDGKGRNDERLCLIKENDNWVVYYLERGIRTTEVKFLCEEDACNYIYNAFHEKLTKL